MSINVIVDYVSGTYKVVGTHNNSKIVEYKKIRGRDGDTYFKVNYNRILMKNRRNEIREKAKELAKEDPTFKISEKALKQIDCVVYKTLVNWDKKANKETDYANQYLKAVLKDYQRQSLKKMNKKQLKNKRASELEKDGINIAYNVGLFNAKEEMTLLDKIKGILIARKQEKLIGAKVKYNLVMDELYDIGSKLSKSKYTTDQVEEDEKTQENEQHNIKERIKVNQPNNGQEQNIEVEEINLKENDDAVKLFRQVIEGKSKRVKMPKINTVRLKGKISRMKKIIKNRKDIPIRLRKYAVRGAVTLLAAGGVIFSAHNIGKMDKNSVEIKEAKNEYGAEYDVSDIDKKNYGYVVITENESETEKQTEAETEAETEAKTEMQTEKQTETETEAKIEMQTEKQTETETEAKIEMQTENKAENKKENKKQKIKELKKYAKQKCMESLIIGEEPKVKDLLAGQTFSSDPSGSGSIGHVDYNPKYKVGHIEIIREDGEPEQEYDLGKNLKEILAKYPDRMGYSIHLISKTDGNLGFITESQLEDCIKGKVKEIVQNKKTKNTKRANKKVKQIEDKGEER